MPYYRPPHGEEERPYHTPHVQLSFMARTRSMLWRSLRILFLLYLLALILVVAFQERITFRPHVREAGLTKADCRQLDSYEEIFVSGTPVYIKRGSAERIIVFYHGSDGLVCDRAAAVSAFALAGYSVAFVEYTSYLYSDVRPTPHSLLVDVLNVQAYLQREGYQETLVVGRHLGATLATFHASLGGVKRLLLITPFPSAHELYAHYLWFIPDGLKSFFWPATIPVTLFAGTVTIPVTVVASREDAVVPSSLSEQVCSLFTRCSFVVTGGSHLDLLYDPAGQENIRTLLRE